MSYLQSVVKTFEKIFLERKIDPEHNCAQPICFAERQYRFMQDGDKMQLSWNDFRYYTISIAKFISPTSKLYELLCSVNSINMAYKDSDTPYEDRELFKIEWIVAYDQLKSMCADIKACGAMFICLDYDYYVNKINEYETSNDEMFLTKLRKETQMVMRNCIAYNYYQSLWLNERLPKEEGIYIHERSTNQQKRIAEEVSNRKQ